VPGLLSIKKAVIAERWRELLNQMNLYYLRILEEAVEKESELLKKGELTMEERLMLIYIEAIKRIISEELDLGYKPFKLLDVDDSIIGELKAIAETA
jgi:hypothetical protein